MIVDIDPAIKEEGEVAINKLSASEFQKEVQESAGRVVVDFYADWCGPCRLVAPELEELSSKWDGSVRFVTVDIDESPELASQYGVYSIPTIILFENGRVAAQTMGARPADAIEHELGLAHGHAPADSNSHDLHYC